MRHLYWGLFHIFNALNFLMALICAIPMLLMNLSAEVAGYFQERMRYYDNR